MSLDGLDLFKLLPAVYRIGDARLAQSQTLLSAAETAELGALQALAPPLSADQQAQLDLLLAKASRGPLQSLMMVIQEQLAIVADDIDQLYDDQFIETCAAWVIPYIGDLIGYQAVKGIAPAIDNPRAEVAHTISFRRRKGTILVMEQLARDATGWGAHAVEFFRVLADTQYMNHVRRDNFYAPDLRRWEPGLFIDTGFDWTAHKVDVRRIASGRGRYNIQNIGIFLWSLSAYSVTKTPATTLTTNAAGEPFCFRFNALGMDQPLFHKAVSQGADISAPARPVNVADRLRRRQLCADIQKGVGASYYGEGNSVVVYIDDKPLNPYQVHVCDLSGPDGSWVNLPTGAAYAATIDPQLGRLALPAAATGAPPQNVTVSYEYGFNADLGGGEYSRAQDPNGFLVSDPASIFPFPDTAGVPRYSDLQGAVDYATAALSETGQAAVEITGTQIISLAGTPALAIDLPAGTTLELRAADQARSTLLLDAEITVIGAAASTFVVSGLLIAGSQQMAPANPSPVALVHIPAQAANGSSNQLGQLSFTHCTFVPGWSVTSSGEPNHGNQPSLVAEPSGLQVTIGRSIVGAASIGKFVTVGMSDSVLDATDPTHVAYAGLDGSSGGGALTLEGCTVIGKVHATLLTLVSDSIFQAWLASGDTWTAPLIADRKQAGCVRFSYLPLGAITPRRFECVEHAPGSPQQPLFFSLRYGASGYAKLLASTSAAIRRGADDAGEMGAFHFLLAPLRESDLRIRMQEYLPVGMEFGVIYQN